MEGKEQTDDTWHENGCTDQVELEDALLEGEVVGVVFAVDLEEEVDHCYGDGADWEAGGVSD